MDQATQLWTWWLSLLRTFAPVFTRPGWIRFVQWVTGMVLCWEEHTMTQLLTALAWSLAGGCWSTSLSTEPGTVTRSKATRFACSNRRSRPLGPLSPRHPR
jgi:hypothetical protein